MELPGDDLVSPAPCQVDPAIIHLEEFEKIPQAQLDGRRAVGRDDHIADLQPDPIGRGSGDDVDHREGVPVPPPAGADRQPARLTGEGGAESRVRLKEDPLPVVVEGYGKPLEDPPPELARVGCVGTDALLVEGEGTGRLAENEIPDPNGLDPAQNAT